MQQKTQRSRSKQSLSGNSTYVLATGAVTPPGEITDEVKESMIRTVCNARCKAYEQRRNQPTMFESLSAAYTEVFSFLRADARHFHSSPDGKLKRKLGEKCHCMLIKAYTQLSGNQITGLASVSTLEKGNI
jgi:hypothetical protein